MACSASGTGEYIIRSSLAKVIGEKVLQGITIPPRTTRTESTEAISTASNEDAAKDDEDREEDQTEDTHQILQTILENEIWGMCLDHA